MKIKPVHISVLLLLFIVFWFWPRKRQLYETVTKKSEDKCPEDFKEITTNLCRKA